MRILAGLGAEALAEAIAGHLDDVAVSRELSRFPDGELHVELQQDVRDADLYLVQSTGPAAQEHLFALLLLADAAAREGAGRITAVVPYLAYARQDRRTAAGEPVGLRVVADLISGSAVDRLVTVDPHTPDLEAVFGIDVELLSAEPLLAEAVRDRLPEDTVVVAPDLGAVKLAERYAARLDRPVALVRKERLSGDQVEATEVVGDVAGRTLLIVDDMVSTGGTLVGAVDRLREAGARPGGFVAATHGLLVGPAVERLGGAGLDALLFSDSVAVDAGGLPVEVVSLASRLGEAIARLHRGRSLGELALYR